MKVSQTNLSACLNISIDFLLQYNSLEELMNYKDNNGYTLLHWAVLNHNSKKVEELLSLNFTLCNSFNNFIPDLPVDVSKTHLEHISNLVIPFNENGYSPLHLCIYLIKLYENNNSHKFLNYIKEQQIIFNSFFKYDDNIIILDKQGYSYVDYCFIVENLELLFTLNQSYEISIDALNNIQPETGFKIVQKLILKNSATDKQDFKKKLELLADILSRNIAHNNLDSIIPNKNYNSKLKKI